MKSVLETVPCSVLSGGATVYSRVWRRAAAEIESCMAEVILVSALGLNSSLFLFGGLLFNLGCHWDRDLVLD